MANTLIIEWRDCAALEGGGTKLSAKVGQNAAPFFEQHYPKGQRNEAHDKAIELLKQVTPKFDDVEAAARPMV